MSTPNEMPITIANFSSQHIPHEMAACNRFPLWKKELDSKGKLTKVPVSVSGYRVDHRKPENHMTLRQAEAIATKSAGSLGVAISLAAEGTKVEHDGKQLYLTCIDFDGFCQKDGTGVDAELVPLLKNLNSYTEISDSTTGCKTFFLTDREPYTATRCKFGASQFAGQFPKVQKYQDRAVEVFSKDRFLALTGELLYPKHFKTMRFIPTFELDAIEAEMGKLAKASGGTGWTRSDKVSSLRPQANNEQLGETFYAKLETESLHLVLSHIDADDEQVWSDVGNALARAYGECGRDAYHAYSKKSDKYDGINVDQRYNRALQELDSRPSGYGVKHLIQMAGQHKNWKNPDLRFEGISSISNLSPAYTAPDYSRGITAAELSTKTFKPLMWIVDEILPEGCYLLSARPKVGKSWLALQVSLAVAFGQPTMGRKVTQGKAIYLALEENQRRLQDRLKLLRPQGYATSELMLFTQWPSFDNGGLEKLIELIHNEKPKLVVIDTLAKVRPAARNNNVYENDYKALAPLTNIAGQYRCCIVVVTHNRKGKSDSDIIEQVSGSLGLMGAVDGALIIDGIRTDKQYKMCLIGRDIPNDDQLAIARNLNGEWTVLGDAKAVFISDERKAIKDLLALHPEGLRPKEVSALLNKKPDATRKIMLTMALDSQLVSCKGNYTLPTNTSIGSYLSISSNSGNTNHSGNV